MVLISYMFMKVFVKWLFRKVWFLRFFLDCFIIKDWRSFRSGLFVLVGSDFSFCREMFGLKSDRLLLDALDRLGGLGRLKLKVVVFGFCGISFVIADQVLLGVEGILVELKFSYIQYVKGDNLIKFNLIIYFDNNFIIVC